MKAIRISLLLVLGCVIPGLGNAGTAYYVDCSAGNNGNGSYANPWNNIASVNNHEFSTGDDLYFKIGTTCTCNEELVINWGGRIDDVSIIGAYHGEAAFGLGGGSRPVLNGHNHSVPSNEWKGLIECKDKSYITVRDLKVEDSGGMGIQFSNCSEIDVTNCYINDSYGQGIIYARVTNGEIYKNTVELASYGQMYLGSSRRGAGITVTATDSIGATTDITVKRNKVFHCFEGIGVYRGSNYCTVEYNVCYDNRSYQIYSDASAHNTYRYNLVYGSSEASRWGGEDYGRSSSAIVLDCEATRNISYGGESEIYGNLIASCSRGISLIANKSEFNQRNNKFYNNTIVDCTQNFFINKDDSGWSGNVITNNISWTISNSWHSNNYSPRGITWSHNNFDEAVSGEAARNAKIYDPKLAKQSGWQLIVPGEATGTEWSLRSDSENEDKGSSVTGYNERICKSNFAANPISVAVTTDMNPSIGAWTGTGTEENKPTPPQNLTVIAVTK